MTLKTLPFDAADALDSPEEQAALLEEAFASGDPRVVTGALGMIARAASARSRSRPASAARRSTRRPARTAIRR
jgi:DNA-binding phage protein